MASFDQAYEDWMNEAIAKDDNRRRREWLEKGLSYGTREFLRLIWYPAVRNFDDLYPEWEVSDFDNGCRYLDLAYMPGGDAKGAIEIQGYGPYPRGIDARRFKDLCWRHSSLALDGWILLPIAYPSIAEEPKRCQQLVLSFIGTFIATDVPGHLSWLEAETVRYARRLLRPFAPPELAAHLHISIQHARQVLQRVTEQQYLFVASGRDRQRTYALRTR